MPNTKEHLKEALLKKDFQEIRNILVTLSPSLMATSITSFPPADTALLFRLLPKELAAKSFDFLPFDSQQELIRALKQEEVANILNDMSPDDRTTLLEELPGNVAKQLLELLAPEERTLSLRLLNYPEKSVGRLMTTNYISVHSLWTVEQVFNHIREVGKDSETLGMVYVIDHQGKLIDDISIRFFLLASLTKTVAEMMDHTFISLKATEDQEQAIGMFRIAGVNALPVVDSEGILIGIVTIDDVLDIAQEEATEDMQKLGAVEVLDQPYMTISLPQMVKKRASWLTVLFIGEMFTATAMGFFEDEINKAVVLALFVPLIISSGGNSGSQAATLVIRALALGEVRIRDWWRIMRREVIAGLALGSILGTMGFLRISVWTLFTDIYGPHWFLIALTVGLSLMGIVLWGTLAGSMLPLALKKVGFDPATSSAPFIATLVDVTGLIIYFIVAMVILKGTLL